MDESILFNSVMRGLLGGRRRKRSRRAQRFLTGGSRGFGAGLAGSLAGGLLSNPQALLAAAGVAWGIFETLQGGQPPATAGATSGAGLGTTGSGPTPPLQGVGGAVAAPMADGVRMVRLAISAAQADGALSEAERAAVMARATEAGLADVVERELAARPALADIVAGVSDPAQRATLYSLAFAVARADEQVGGAERIYLAQLAHLLGLDPAAVERLEKDAAARIDATAEEGE